MVGRVQNSVTATDSHPSTMETKRPKLNSPHVIHETASAADGGVLFTDLPKAVQTAVRAYVDQYNAAESTCMSPRTREFLRATKSDDGYDVTFLEHDWTGKSRGEVNQHFGVAPLAPSGPTTTGDAVTSLDALPAESRAAVLSRIAMLNELESMGMSPKTYAFVSATLQSGGGLSVVLMAKGFMGGGDASTHVLGTDGSFT